MNEKSTNEANGEIFLKNGANIIVVLWELIDCRCRKNKTQRQDGTMSSLYLLSNQTLLHKIPFLGSIDRMLQKHVVKVSAVYPKTKSFPWIEENPQKNCLKFIQSDAMTFVTDNLDQFDCVELTIPGVSHEIKHVLNVLKKNNKEFFVDQIDYIVISKMGVEMVIIELRKPKKPFTSSRSLFIELTGYRSQFLCYNAVLMLILGTLTVIAGPRMKAAGEVVINRIKSVNKKE